MFAAIGVLLIIAGAIITFAIDRTAEGIDLEAIGWILMAGGALSVLFGAIQGAGWMSAHNQNRTFTTERHVTDDGQHYVEEVRQD